MTFILAMLALAGAAFAVGLLFGYAHGVEVERRLTSRTREAGASSPQLRPPTSPVKARSGSYE
jgi:hypothetical protein